MPSPVLPVPASFELQACHVGKAVASPHIARWAHVANTLGGWTLGRIVDTHVPKRRAGRTSLVALTHSIPFGYWHHPGAHVVAVLVQLRPGELPGTGTVNITLPSGGAWISANGLDGSVNFPSPDYGLVSPGYRVGYVDVTSVSTSALTTFLCTSTNVSGLFAGVQQVVAFEVPRAHLDPSVVTAEPGYDLQASLSPTPLVDGSASYGHGTRRIVELMDTHRTKFRTMWQICGIESADNTGTSTNPHWYRNSGGAAALDEWQRATATAHNPTFRFRVRQLYGTGSASHTYRFFVRYKSFDASGTHSCEIALAGGSAQVLSLPATNNVWTLAQTDVTVSGSATDGINTILLGATNGDSSGELLQFSLFGLAEKHL